MDHNRKNSYSLHDGTWINYSRHRGAKANCLYLDGHAVGGNRGELCDRWTGGNAMRYGAIWFP